MKVAAARTRLSTLLRVASLAAAIVVPGLAAAETLPAPKAPSLPFRQTVVGGICESGTCILRFAKVPAGKLLRVDTVNCFAVLKGAALARLFFVSTEADGLQRAFVPAVQDTSIGDVTVVTAAVNGPFFFKAGERILIKSFENAQNDPRCVISGFLSAI
jgi:hypothetical protein